MTKIYGDLALLKNKTHWLFDMDGTLTHAIHDFDAIRAQLNLPAGVPILEAIDAMPTAQAKQISDKLDAIEYEIADQASAQPGSAELLTALSQRGHKTGIVTRNGHGIAKATLKASKLDHYFSDKDIISRDCCAPKPNPDGIELLLKRWQAQTSGAVMIGDYLFDLESGKRAGVATLHLDVHGKFEWPEQTDIGVTNLFAVLDIWN